MYAMLVFSRVVLNVSIKQVESSFRNQELRETINNCWNGVNYFRYSEASKLSPDTGVPLTWLSIQLINYLIWLQVCHNLFPFRVQYGEINVMFLSSLLVQSKDHFL